MISTGGSRTSGGVGASATQTGSHPGSSPRRLFAKPVTAAEIVLDASALLRGLLGESREAEEIVGGVWDGDVQAHAPDLIGPESTHALLRLVRAGRLDVDDARRLADDVERTPLDRHYSLGQAIPAFEFARTTGLSGYDAFYAVLSEMLELPLVTADRKLAAAVDGSVLVV